MWKRCFNLNSRFHTDPEAVNSVNLLDDDEKRKNFTLQHRRPHISYIISAGFMAFILFPFLYLLSVPLKTLTEESRIFSSVSFPLELSTDGKRNKTCTSSSVKQTKTRDSASASTSTSDVCASLLQLPQPQGTKGGGGLRIPEARWSS